MQIKHRPPRSSIWDHVSAHLRPEGGLDPDGAQLPDTDLVQERGLHIWAPGAWEGTAARHAGPDQEKDRAVAAEIYAALLRLIDGAGDESDRDSLRKLFMDASPRWVVDHVIDFVREQPLTHTDRLGEELRSFLLHGEHRNEVKFAIALLALLRDPADMDRFRLIGQHEEFTLYAAIALAGLTNDPVAEWIALARLVTGWGKVELIDLLMRTNDPRACHFALREPDCGPTLTSYVALNVVRHCRLDQELNQLFADPELLSGAALLLSTMAQADVEGGPVGGLLHYPEGSAAVGSFLELMASRATRLEDFLVVDTLWKFAAADWSDEELAHGGWDRNSLARILEACEEIERRSQWPAMAEAALADADPAERNRGFQVAKQLGLPIREHVVGRLRQDPLEGSMWFELVSQQDESHMDQAVALAQELLDLDLLASGPSDDLGLGPAFQLHRCVDFILQELARFPGKGWPVIRVALRSTVIRNRMLALRALEGWPPEKTVGDVAEAIRECVADPVDSVSQKAQELLLAHGSSSG